MCHAAKPAHEGFAEAPKGVMLETIEDIRRYAPLIEAQAVKSEVMPLGNETGMTAAGACRAGRLAGAADERASTLRAVNAMRRARFRRGVWRRRGALALGGARRRRRPALASRDDDGGGVHAPPSSAQAAERQMALLNAHPDLAGRAAIAGELTEASRGEQAGAGLDRLTRGRVRAVHRLNAAYRERFGFPFILAVKGADKHTILAAFEARIASSREDGVRHGARQVARIVAFRLEDRVDG